MNSALQCLSSVQILTVFVISYEESEDRRGFSKQTLIGVYSKLIKNICSGEHQSISPKEFRNKVSNLFDEFRGWGQKDCSELINKVLDQFHEELMIKQFGYSSQISEYPTFENYLQCNDTFIARNFQGYRKTQTFCHCGQIFIQSSDPFFVLDLPQLEPKPMKTIKVSLVTIEQLQQKVYVFNLRFDCNRVVVSQIVSKVNQLFQANLKRQLNEEQLIVTKIDNSSISKIYCIDSVLELSSIDDNIFIYQTQSNQNTFVILRKTGYFGIYTDAFGIPLLLDTQDYSKFRPQFIRKLFSGSRDYVFNECNNRLDKRFCFYGINSIDKSGHDILIVTTDPVPYRLIVDHYTQFESNSLISDPIQNNVIRVEDCLEKYLSTKCLDDTLFCNACQRETVPHTKSQLLHAPNVLMLKLKTDPTKQYRYNSSGCQFGAYLNLEPYLSDEGQYIYELTAVSNYGGSGSSGHYTAYAKNSNLKWYNFNDSYCREVNQKEVCSSQAYLLVYCKSNLN